MCISTCLLAWIAWRHVTRSKFLRKGLAGLAAVLCAAGLWVGWSTPWWRNPQDGWRKLQAVASALQAQAGAERWSLPKGSSCAVVSAPAEGGNERRIAVYASDRWLAYVFGLDLFQYNFVRVVVGPDGRLRRAWADLF